MPLLIAWLAIPPLVSIIIVLTKKNFQLKKEIRQWKERTGLPLPEPPRFEQGEDVIDTLNRSTSFIHQLLSQSLNMNDNRFLMMVTDINRALIYWLNQLHYQVHSLQAQLSEQAKSSTRAQAAWGVIGLVGGVLGGYAIDHLF